MATAESPKTAVKSDEKSKSGGKNKSSLPKHKTKIPGESMKESERALQKLLEDFENGKLNAFGNSNMLSQLNEIREIQENLTLRHFEIDQMRIRHDSSTEGYKDEASLHELTQTLEKLGTSIQSLHSGADSSSVAT